MSTKRLIQLDLGDGAGPREFNATALSGHVADDFELATDHKSDMQKIDEWAGDVNTHVDDSDIHVTAQQKASWSEKQDAISDLATIRNGAAAGASAVQPADDISTLTNDAGYLTLATLPIYDGSVV